MSRQGLRASDIRIEQQNATIGRGMRRPEYNFAGQVLDEYRLYPAAFIPVLAGDTVATAVLQSRIIGTASMSNSLTRGAWAEHWLFYVRIGDMADAENIRDLLIDPAATDTIDWRDQCMQSIWKGYFADEGDGTTWSYTTFLRNPRVGWWDSSRDAADLPDVSGEPDEWNEQWVRYQAMRRAKLTMKTWEEYLAAQGVNVPPQLRQEHDTEAKIPELLQYTREFVYPQMSLSPSTGGSIVPQATFQWFVNDRLKRSRFCAEPGFLVQCMAMRPKRYVVGYNSSGGTGSGTGFDPLTMFNDAGGWQPIDLDTDPHSALRVTDGAPFGDTVAGHDQVIDSREILLHGHDEWISSNSPRQVTATGIDITRIDPVGGSRPTAATYTFNCDLRLKLGIKSRVNKDTTR